MNFLLFFFLMNIVSNGKSATPIAVSTTPKNVPLETKVGCEPGMVVILIPVSAVKSSSTGNPVSPDHVIFRMEASEHCRGIFVDSQTYSISINVTSNNLCGSIVKEKGSRTSFENGVMWMDTEGGKIRSLVNFTCFYRDGVGTLMLPSSSSAASVNLAATRESGRIEMNLFRDKSYSEKAKLSNHIPEISVGHFLFVSVDLILPTAAMFLSSRIHVISSNCFASYHPDPMNRNMSHKFISNGCAGKLDSTVRIESNGESLSSRWKFQMFKWVNVSTQRIYLFCEVKTCGKDQTTDQCYINKTKENCFGVSRGRTQRDVITVDSTQQMQAHIIGIGPIFPKDSTYLLDFPILEDEDALNNRVGTTANPAEIIPTTVGVVSGVCVIILLIAFFMIWKRYAARKEASKESKKINIEQGFAFAMRSSNDPDIFHSVVEGSGVRGPGQTYQMDSDNDSIESSRASSVDRGRRGSGLSCQASSLSSEHRKPNERGSRGKRHSKKSRDGTNNKRSPNGSNSDHSRSRPLSRRGPQLRSISADVRRSSSSYHREFGGNIAESRKKDYSEDRIHAKKRGTKR